MRGTTTAILLLALVPALGAQAASSKASPSRYGALAYHRASSSFGYAVNQPADRAARVEALRQCVNPRCEVVLRFKNDCGAVADGARSQAVGKGATRQEAETKALRLCGAGCEIVGWACSR